MVVVARTQIRAQIRVLKRHVLHLDAEVAASRAKSAELETSFAACDAAREGLEARVPALEGALAASDARAAELAARLGEREEALVACERGREVDGWSRCHHSMEASLRAGARWTRRSPRSCERSARPT